MTEQEQCFPEFRLYELLSRFLFLAAACGATLQPEDLAVIGWILSTHTQHLKDKKEENHVQD